MAFTPQNDSGSAQGANSYVRVAGLRLFWADRGIDLSAKTDAELEAAAVKATDYLDARHVWVGYQRERLQGTQWPRGGVTSFLSGLPPALTKATYLMAYRAITAELMPDPAHDVSGQKVIEVAKEVGAIKTQTKFSSAVGSGGAAASVPEYPEVTLLLQAAGLVASASCGEVHRA